MKRRAVQGKKRRAAERGWGGPLELQCSRRGRGGWPGTEVRGTRRQPCALLALSVSFVWAGQ